LSEPFGSDDLRVLSKYEQAPQGAWTTMPRGDKDSYLRIQELALFNKGRDREMASAQSPKKLLAFSQASPKRVYNLAQVCPKCVYNLIQLRGSR
jgi:hypothetical protein